jgi:hypothetical protein
MEGVKKIRIRYNKESLDELLEIDNASDTGSYTHFTQKSIISFICNCGEQTSKKLFYIKKTGAYCKKCFEKNRRAKTTETNLLRYGCAFVTQSEKVKEKTKKTCLEKYGVENPAQNTNVRDKMKETMLHTYGVEHALQVTGFKDKFKETLNERYGVSVPYHSKTIRDRGAEKCKQIYGVENPFQNEQVKEKIIQTNLAKYGVEHPSQNNEIMLKAQANAKKYKKYTMPSGEIRNVQGYEPYALTELLKVYSEEQIKTDRKDIPRIKYLSGEKERYYFPDMYIPDDKKIIEVKSVWTYKCKNDNIILKKEATEKLGYLYEMWIFDGNGKRVLPENI